jgi:cytoskeletal protein CcmA (bactofilin family)
VIHPTGKVAGKIRYGRIVIEEGGEVAGDVGALGAQKPAVLQPTTKPVEAAARA